jgi:hypothetical protein
MFCLTVLRASEDLEEMVVVGSVEELEQLSGKRVTDLHRHFIDDIVIPSKQVGNPPIQLIYHPCSYSFVPAASGSTPITQGRRGTGGGRSVSTV